MRAPGFRCVPLASNVPYLLTHIYAPRSRRYNVRKKCVVSAPDGVCRSYLRQTLRFPTSNWLHLVCGVGEFTSLLKEAANDKDRFMPISDADFTGALDLFAVDTSYTFTAGDWQEGELVCFANDADGLYHDNLGSVEVTVTRDSWPPSVQFDLRYVEVLKESLENPSKYDRFDFDGLAQAVYDAAEEAEEEAEDLD